jgi:hypothetical protein
VRELLRERRNFLAYFAGAGLSSTLLPGALWAKLQERGASQVTPDLIEEAANSPVSPSRVKSARPWSRA